MARDYFLNGETLVSVKGPTGSTIASLTELGLAESPIVVTPHFRHKAIKVDAWGDGAPETQFFLASVTVSMSLVHIDRTVLDECIRLAMAGGAGVGTAVGRLPRAGARMGNGGARFASNNNYIGLNLYSPVGNKPWRFYFAYLMDPLSSPLGTERTPFGLQWQVDAYTVDPWNSGSGASGTTLWDHQLDV